MSVTAANLSSPAKRLWRSASIRKKRKRKELEEENTLGRVLCSLRHLHGYTAPQLSQAVGITESELLCIERGKCLPPITIIQRLAQALDINEKVIMFFCEDKELLAQCDRKRSEAPLHLRNRLLRMLRFV